jgi:hypothetical protein
VNALRLAYLALAVGLMGFGALWCWLGLRRAPGPPPRATRLVAGLLLLVAAAGTLGAVVLEHRAARPW